MHTGVDADTGRIVAVTLSTSNLDDAWQVCPLLHQVMVPVASFTADGAYDQQSVYDDVAARHLDAAVIVPP
ncbi:MAG: transposase [Janthinobacterium lividum]